MTYFQEDNGDYMMVDLDSFFGGMYMTRATAISGLLTSVMTTHTHPEYLDKCIKVAAEDVPEEWLEVL